MTTINLFANDQLLTAVLKPKIASGDMNSVLIHVDFDPIWDRFSKSAVFFTDLDNTVYEMILTDGECTVPHEVLAKPGCLNIGIRGVCAADGAVKTSTLVKYKISEGAPVGDGTSVEPTPDVYQQLMTLANDAKEIAQSVRDDADAGKFAGYIPVRGVDYWTESDKDEIVSEVTPYAVTNEMIQQVIDTLATPVFGRVDENNNIILSGELVNGTYTLKYENADGELITIGTITQTSGGVENAEPIIPVWNKGYKLDSSTGVAGVDAENTYAYSDGIPFVDGTEIRISCIDSEEFHCHWYYYDSNDNFVGKRDWMVGTYNGTVTPMQEAVIPQLSGAAVVKLRCNIVVADATWSDLDRLTVTRVVG